MPVAKRNRFSDLTYNCHLVESRYIEQKMYETLSRNGYFIISDAICAGNELATDASVAYSRFWQYTLPEGWKLSLNTREIICCREWKCWNYAANCVIGFKTASISCPLSRYFPKKKTYFASAIAIGTRFTIHFVVVFFFCVLLSIFHFHVDLNKFVYLPTC